MTCIATSYFKYFIEFYSWMELYTDILQYAVLRTDLLIKRNPQHCELSFPIFPSCLELLLNIITSALLSLHLVNLFISIGPITSCLLLWEVCSIDKCLNLISFELLGFSYGMVSISKKLIYFSL